MTTCNRLNVNFLTCSFISSLSQAAQIALALLGLTYSVNGADKIVPTVLGTVAITNLTNIQTQKVVSSSAQSSSQALNAARFTANRYVHPP